MKRAFLLIVVPALLVALALFTNSRAECQYGSDQH